MDLNEIRLDLEEILIDLNEIRPDLKEIRRDLSVKSIENRVIIFRCVSQSGRFQVRHIPDPNRPMDSSTHT